jgi:hypothetical protein
MRVVHFRAFEVAELLADPLDDALRRFLFSVRDATILESTDDPDLALSKLPTRAPMNSTTDKFGWSVLLEALLKVILSDRFDAELIKDRACTSSCRRVVGQNRRFIQRVLGMLRDVG